jgi:hypothetical protein
MCELRYLLIRKQNMFIKTLALRKNKMEMKRKKSFAFWRPSWAPPYSRSVARRPLTLARSPVRLSSGAVTRRGTFGTRRRSPSPRTLGTSMCPPWKSTQARAPSTGSISIIRKEFPMKKNPRRFRIIIACLSALVLATCTPPPSGEGDAVTPTTSPTPPTWKLVGPSGFSGSAIYPLLSFHGTVITERKRRS